MVGHCVEFVSGEEVEMKVEGETQEQGLYSAVSLVYDHICY